MFEHLLKVVTKSAPGNDNDFADRLNYRYTAAVYMLMSMAIIGRTYIAEPIECWTPSYFTDPWIAYTNNLCFVESTYYIPMDMDLDEGIENKNTRLIAYYQWIPLFFMVLAMCFYVPRAVWFNVFSHHFVDINAIVDLLTSFDNAVNPETRDPAVDQVAKHIDRYFLSTVEYRDNPYFKLRTYLAKKKFFLFYCGRRTGLAIATIYLNLKLCYIIIGILQIYWIDSFLMGSNASLLDYYLNIFTESYAIKLLIAVASNSSSLELSPTFPRVTMCEFQVRSVGELLTFNVQCVLPLNLFNEKIFLFLWMWIAFVLIMTCTNMMAWLWRIAISWNREHYIMKHLKLMGKLNEENMRHHRKVTKRLMRDFIHDYLRPDGVFLLRLISINTNCLISSEIISALWENFLDHGFIAKRAEEYHDELKDIGLLNDEDDNRVLASLKAMNIKASTTTVDSNTEHYENSLRPRDASFSIFQPLTGLQPQPQKFKPSEMEHQRKGTAKGKKFSAQFKVKNISGDQSQEVVNSQPKRGTMMEREDSFARSTRSEYLPAKQPKQMTASIKQRQPTYKERLQNLANYTSRAKQNLKRPGRNNNKTGKDEEEREQFFSPENENEMISLDGLRNLQPLYPPTALHPIPEFRAESAVLGPRGGPIGFVGGSSNDRVNSEVQSKADMIEQEMKEQQRQQVQPPPYSTSFENEINNGSGLHMNFN